MKTRSKAALARIDRTFTPQVVQQLAEIEQDLGGRDAIVGMLVLAPLTPDLRYILGMLGDPDHQSTSLAELCATANILPGELLQQLSRAALMRGQIQAAQVVGKGIAAVAADVMERAAPYTDTCSECLGTGTITPEPTPAAPNPSPGPCEVCRATGKLLYRPDLERQKLAVELAQLLPKSGGIQIAMQQNNAGGGGGGSQGQILLERLQALSDQVLYRPGSGEDLTAEDLQDLPEDLPAGAADSVEGEVVDE